MRQQLCSNHGNIGDSLTAVKKLSGEHEKFSETAKASDMSVYHLRTRTRALLTRRPIAHVVGICSRVRVNVNAHFKPTIVHIHVRVYYSTTVPKYCVIMLHLVTSFSVAVAVVHS